MNFDTLLPPHDVARVAHVPGLQMRRAQWLSQVGAVKNLLNRRRGRKISQPMDDSHGLYDYMTFFALTTGATLRRAFRDQFMNFWNGNDHQSLHFALWAEHADLFVAAAALGDLALLREFPRLRDQMNQPLTVPVDLARMMELACVNGHVSAAEWLTGDEASEWTTRVAKAQGQHAPSWLRDGLCRAVGELTTTKRDENKTLDAIRDLTAKLHVDLPSLITTATQGEPLDDDDAQAAQPLEVDQAARPETNHAAVAINVGAGHKQQQDTYAFSVLTNSSLMARIGSFQEHPEVTVQLFMEQSAVIATLSTQLPQGGPTLQLSNLPGVLPRVAIIEGNLPVLRSIWSAYRLRHSSTPMYSFRLAMHFAATEGQLEILKWLHTRPGTKHKCRPDTMVMAVRCGWPKVVEWLHFNCPESAQTMSAHCVNDAARWGLVDTLLVCHTYDLGEITVATIESAAQGGQLAAVQCLHLLREDLSTATAMDIALRQGHVSVVEWLHNNCAQAIHSDRLKSRG